MRLCNDLRLPDFIGIGPPRTATTWLNGVLAARVGLPANVKETDFFSANYNHGLSWYGAHFRHCRQMPIVGEFSPNYFHSATARNRMRRDLPELKILCTLRDPVERLYSHYRLKTRFYSRSVSLSAALEQDAELVSASRYAQHLESWLDTFGASQVFTAFHDQLADSPQEFVDSICAFLDIPAIDLRNSPAAMRRGLKNAVTHAPMRPRLAAAANRLKLRLQVRGYGRVERMLGRLKVWRWCSQPGNEFAPLPKGLELRLRDIFRPEVERLENLLNRDLTAWKLGPRSAESERYALGVYTCGVDAGALCIPQPPAPD